MIINDIDLQVACIQREPNAMTRLRMRERLFRAVLQEIAGGMCYAECACRNYAVEALKALDKTESLT